MIKKDAINIAKLGKFEDIKAYSSFDISVFTLKVYAEIIIS